MSKNYLYVSPSPDGWCNLAADEYFIDHMGEDDVLLYFYINRNAVIIGRSQNPWQECDLAAMERDEVQLVRRITGGGAVYHDSGNLNFSFIMGEKHYDVHRQLSMILSAVRALGIPCDFSGRNDLLADGRKFSGNAFCQRGGIRQHHGTLLLNSDLDRLKNYLTVDPRKLQAKGVKSVRSRVCNLSEFVPGLNAVSMIAALKEAFRAEYGEFEELTGVEEAALEPYLEKQRSNAWRLGETPRFDYELEDRFSWGNVQILLTVLHGRLENVRVFSDAIDAELADEISARLTGLPANAQTMAQALLSSEKEQVRMAAILAERSGL